MKTTKTRISEGSSRLRFTGQEVVAVLEEEEEGMWEGIEEDGGMEDIYASDSEWTLVTVTRMKRQLVWTVTVMEIQLVWAVGHTVAERYQAARQSLAHRPSGFVITFPQKLLASAAITAATTMNDGCTTTWYCCACHFYLCHTGEEESDCFWKQHH